MPNIQYSSLGSATIFLYLVVLVKLSFAASKSSGFSLKLIPRDAPEFSFYPANLTQFERIQRLTDFSNAKVAQILKSHSTSLNATFDDEKHLSILLRQAQFYIAEMVIGTPSEIEYLLVDTGGGMVWTQCQPCERCFHQEISIFDPRSSSSYESLSCEHAGCNHLSPYSPHQCVDDRCVYSFGYGSFSGPTMGVVSLERFQFLTASGGLEAFRVLFGCSNDNRNFIDFDREGNKISGILGLDVSPESLSSQMHDHIGGIFSYCVVVFEDSVMRPHLLRFGDDVVLPPGNIPQIQYFSFFGSYHYYLNCEDISIEDTRLQLPSGTFTGAPTHGFIIDSGCPFTMLTTQSVNGINVYQAVMTELASFYDNNDYESVPDNLVPAGFRLCYWYKRGRNDFASMTFHFQEADYVVDGIYMNINNADEGFFCVAIKGGPGISILGAVHMQNVRIIHNANINAIQFYSANCAADHV